MKLKVEMMNPSVKVEFDDYDVVYLSELKGSESFEFVEISSLTFNKLFSDYYSLKEIIDDKKK